MFTIKAIFTGGHAVYECASYRYRKPGAEVPGFLVDKDHPQLDMFDAAGDLLRTLTLTEGACYVMNANGKTIDTLFSVQIPGPA